MVGASSGARDSSLLTCLKLVMGNSLSVRGIDNKTEIMCIITSGSLWSNIRRSLYLVLSNFGAISKFTALENTRPPAFLVTFFDTSDACNIINTLDGQYIEVCVSRLVYVQELLLMLDRVSASN